jgi:predicted DNA-binding antitoxin AbrB/MazE fold protein
MYISDEIEIRVESLKHQLDELHTQFKDKLEKIRNEIEFVN